MTGPASWVLSPTDGKTHLLARKSPGETLATQCGQALPSGVLQHDRQLCPECFAAYLLPPDPVFTRQAPAGCRLSAPESTPGGQPVTPPCPSASRSAEPAPRERLRWARCPADQRLHLLSAGEVATAGSDGHGQAACGRLIPAAGLTIESPPEGFCVGCLAMGTVR